MRLNVNKGSVGMSFGVRGARYSVNTSGRRTTSVGIPGTGLYSVQTSQGSGGSGKRRSSGTSKRYGRLPAAGALTTVTPDVVDRIIPKTGLLSSSAEKHFRAGIVAYVQQDWQSAAAHFEETARGDARNVSDDFFLGATYVRLQRIADAAPYLERVVGSHIALPDQLMSKYVPGVLEMDLPITEHVSARVGFDSVGAAMVLAELYQELGRKQEAIGMLQRLQEILPEDDAIRLSLADLLYDDNDFASLVELTQGVENRDDVTLATLHLRAKALANEGLLEPAAELLSACLRRTAGRDADLLKEIRYNRAEAYELLGDRRKAKADWSKLVAEDAFYRDARDRLAALGSP
jgi:tetratricopeptide (TPR) repeat protein